MTITDTDGRQHELADAYVSAAVRRLRSSGRGNRTIDLGEYGGVASYAQVTDGEAERIIRASDDNSYRESSQWRVAKSGFENLAREIDIDQPDGDGLVSISFADYSDDPPRGAEVQIPFWVLERFVRFYGGSDR